MKRQIKTDNIAIIGLGLMGGSLAKTIRKYYPETNILGYNRSAIALEKAYAEKTICNSTNPSLDEIGKCDLIFLCLPVEINVRFLKDLIPYLREETIITDVGSVKGDIEKAIIELGLTDKFIGGHPMCGKEQSKFDAATDDLYDNAYYILCPGKNVEPDITESFKDYIQSLHALPMIMDAAKHDEAVAAISHLPHFVAFSLVSSVASIEDPYGILPAIAAGGFKDITRIASSDPVMWEEIFATNKYALLPLLDRFESEIKKLRKFITEDDSENIKAYIADSKEYRDSLPVLKTGFLPPSYELYVDLPDSPGAIAQLSGYLAEESLNIRDMDIVHNREYTAGVCRVAFYDEATRDNAKELLKKLNYNIYER